jgi:hypothetical protein
MGKGRAIKEWVQVPHIHVAHWPSFADLSHRYVSTLQIKTGRPFECGQPVQELFFAAKSQK